MSESVLDKYRQSGKTYLISYTNARIKFSAAKSWHVEQGFKTSFKDVNKKTMFRAG